MAKAKKASKPRADKYEEKVSFNGTFDELINVSVKDAEKRLKKLKSQKTTKDNG